MTGAHTSVGSLCVVVTMLGETRRAAASPRVFPGAEQIVQHIKNIHLWYKQMTSFYLPSEAKFVHVALSLGPNQTPASFVGE